MFVTLINQRGHAAPAKIIKPAADERELLRRQVLDQGVWLEGS